MFSSQNSQVSSANYIEEVFSTYLYTGNGSTQTITNGIDLAGEGGLVWSKARSSALSNFLCDTVRGRAYYLYSDATVAQQGPSAAGNDITSFNSNGYSLGSNANADINTNAVTYASWTFRKQPKFFDVQQVTLGASTNRQVAHNLASVPGVIIGKKTNGSGNWVVYHRSLGINKWLALQTTDAETSRTGTWGTSNPTATDFYFDETYFGSSGDTYIFYLFAHDAGGFGLTGTDNVISCGTFDANNGEVINLGYEPQWLLYKASSDVDNWRIADNMRGLTNLAGTNAQTIKQLRPNSSAAESENSGPVLTSTGFTWNQSGGGVTHIYIAIRRGPMKVPTSGTSVFYPLARTGTGTATSISGVGFVPDFFLSQNRNAPGDPGPASSLSIVLSRITNLKFLRTQTTSAEGDSTEVTSWNQSGVSLSADTYGRVNDTSVNTINYFVGRAPSFMDVVCYTGNDTAPMNVPHNLGVTPQLMIIKKRSGTEDWNVFNTVISDAYGGTGRLFLNNTDAYLSTGWAAPIATSTAITLDTGYFNNQSGSTYVAYLFATCVGVSKVGSYTGTATTLQVNCGFTSGARFVLIKRTDSTGAWYFWDSARGIVSGNDPYLLLNGTAAEVTSTDYVDTYSAGFEISSTAPSAINASGGTFLFLAIA